MSMSQHATLADYIASVRAEKPVVKYLREDADIVVGTRASVVAVDHPRLGFGVVSTSKVLTYDPETGVFETLNTVYIPQKDVASSQQPVVQ